MHVCTKRPEDRRFGRLSKVASCPNAGACASIPTFPENRNGTPFQSPSWRSCRLEKKLSRAFRRVEQRRRVGRRTKPASGPPSQTASMKFGVKIGKTRKIRSGARRTRTFLGGRQRIRRDFNDCRGETNFSRFTSEERTRRAVSARPWARTEVFPLPKSCFFPDRA